MTYKEARVYLDNASKYGSVLGLDTIRDLLGELGNPQDELKFIHIAGTNGKGSVLAYISTILSEAGYRVGRYVSPTVISYLERIQTDGRWIGEDDFAESAEKVQKAVARMETDGKASPTVFEMETAIAFLYFRKMKCDYVVLETGLGGREDATNIVKNTVLAVFATISRDHMGVLGDTLEEIAAEKAGIIKPGCKVVSTVQEPCVRKVLEQKARECRCPITFAEPEKAVIEEESYRGQRFLYKERADICIALAGKYQILNAVTALEAVTALADISEEAIRRGFEKTVWAGRFTCLREKPFFIVDGAHNEDAAKQLRQTVEKYFAEKRLICIMGVFRDKEYEKIARIMGPLADKIFTVDLPDKNRTLDAVSLKCVLDAEYEKSGWNVRHTAERIGNNVDCAATESAGEPATSSESVCERVIAVGDIGKAVESALEEAAPEDVVLAFGSLSYLGRVMEIVKRGQEI